MTYQHTILPVGAHLEIRVEPELRGYLMVKYRCVDPRFAHRDDWREVPHCSWAEAYDVVAAVVDGYASDLTEQQAW